MTNGFLAAQGLLTCAALWSGPRQRALVMRPGVCVCRPRTPRSSSTTAPTTDDERPCPPAGGAADILWPPTAPFGGRILTRIVILPVSV